jgi:hypothetical protein
MAVRLFQVFLALNFCLLVSYQMAKEGLIAREQISFAPGIHWYAILIFLVMFVAYVIVDNTTILFFPFVAIAYYALHEGIFNLLFLGYHGFTSPPDANASWFTEIGSIIVVLFVYFTLVLAFRNRLFRKDSWHTAWKLWTAFLVFNLVWIALGYPLTVDVYNTSNYGTTNGSVIANLFELGYNILFSLAFFFTFTFHIRKQSSSAVKDPITIDPEKLTDQ